MAAEVQQVITDLKGEVGARKRENLDKVRRDAFASLDEGGDAYLAMKELVIYGTPKL